MLCSSVVGLPKTKGMDLPDNDIQRIVDRLRPTLPQILQNVGDNQFGNQSASISNRCKTPERVTTQFLLAQTGQTSSAITEAAALSQLFRRPSYVKRHGYATPYQRYNRRSTATTASNKPQAILHLRIHNPLQRTAPTITTSPAPGVFRKIIDSISSNSASVTRLNCTSTAIPNSRRRLKIARYGTLKVLAIALHLKCLCWSASIWRPLITNLGLP